ncbi:Hypothetical predicted protein [Olea europaea subsp. europaea]|uniref:Uncharacterized protein n=1 Tax=Olea europaea subsp. europaea TaxID=158383 RepID=A0A8S0UN44_OLEEU|nr:Hypothetical predicted protein [Olea europaea subsp. europaea]
MVSPPYFQLLRVRLLDPLVPESFSTSRAVLHIGEPWPMMLSRLLASAASFTNMGALCDLPSNHEVLDRLKEVAKKFPTDGGIGPLSIPSTSVSTLTTSLKEYPFRDMKKMMLS